jgi:hypothetical protein
MQILDMLKPSADEWATSKVGDSPQGDSLLGDTPGGRQYQYLMGDRSIYQPVNTATGLLFPVSQDPGQDTETYIIF